MSTPSKGKRAKGSSGTRAAEPWEVERLHREFPVKSREEIEQTATSCKEQADEDQEKDKLARCVQRKLSK